MSKEESKVYRARYHKERRYWLIQHGMCQSHPQMPVALGNTRCQKCIDRMKESKKRNNENGMCQNHPQIPVALGKTVCEQCLRQIQNRNLQRKYGIDIQEKAKMFENQHGLCWFYSICGNKLPFEYLKANVDHDHETGRVRALLCNRCNRSMAAVDDEKWLAKAIEYRGEFRGTKPKHIDESLEKIAQKFTVKDLLRSRSPLGQEFLTN